MSKYIEFVFIGLSISRKTKIYYVVSKKNSDVLGVVKWFSSWRQYCFFPTKGTVFNYSCLWKIRDFLKSLNDTKRLKIG